MWKFARVGLSSSRVPLRFVATVLKFVPRSLMLVLAVTSVLFSSPGVDCKPVNNVSSRLLFPERFSSSSFTFFSVVVRLEATGSAFCVMKSTLKHG